MYLSIAATTQDPAGQDPHHSTELLSLEDIVAWGAPSLQLVSVVRAVLWRTKPKP